MAEDVEIPLRGGIAPRGIVRVGDTVRRPLKPDAVDVHALLRHFEVVGFDGAPRFLGIDAKNREIVSYIEGWAPLHNGYRLSEDAVRAGGRLLRRVHDLTEGTKFASGAEVACHPNLSQPNFVFRGSLPVAIIDWDGTRPGTRLRNFADFLWAFVHPAVYGEGDPAERMLRLAVDAYGWTGAGLTDAMLEVVRDFQDVVRGAPEAMAWGAGELEYMERNAHLFRSTLG